jgi:hypothetical protein
MVAINKVRPEKVGRVGGMTLVKLPLSLGDSITDDTRIHGFCVKAATELLQFIGML